MAELSEYGRAVKHRLIDRGMTQAQLIDEVKKRSGLYCDCSLMNKVLTGRCRREKIISTINEVLELQ